MTFGALWYLGFAHGIKRKYFSFTFHELWRRLYIMTFSLSIWSGMLYALVFRSATDVGPLMAMLGTLAPEIKKAQDANVTLKVLETMEPSIPFQMFAGNSNAIDDCEEPLQIFGLTKSQPV